MGPLFTQKRVILSTVFVALLILLVTFVANGSEYEDAWLYLSSAWIILIPLLELRSKKQKKS